MNITTVGIDLAKDVITVFSRYSWCAGWALLDDQALKQNGKDTAQVSINGTGIGDLGRAAVNVEVHHPV